MCTAFNAHKNGHFFGRNLDLDRSLGEQVIITPRNVPLTFRTAGTWESHLAFIGMGVTGLDMPLYYDGVNEKGLCMAGLNFPRNAVYHPVKEGHDNIPPFEFIPWILGQCGTLQEVRRLFHRLNLADIALHPKVPHSPLHWLISDREGSLVVESQADGLHVYENPAQILTNNPPFPLHLFQLNNFRGLNPATPENTFLPELSLDVYAQGLGAMGLPGDVSSMSRFVRGAFHLHNSTWEDPISQVFHILDSVKMLRGACRTDAGTWDETVYSACMDADSGKYYYTTYGNRRITCVDMHQVDLDGSTVHSYPLITGPDIRMQNESFMSQATL